MKVLGRVERKKLLLGLGRQKHGCSRLSGGSDSLMSSTIKKGSISLMDDRSSAKGNLQIW